MAFTHRYVGQLGDALMKAAKYGTPAVIQAMIAQGADPSYQDFQGQSPIHEAVEYGKRNNTKALIKHGGNVNAENCIGATPLCFASAIYPDAALSTTKALLEAGADPNITTKNGVTPLHFARSPEIAQVLLASGANANAQDDCGDTPLHTSVEQKNAALVGALLAGGADPSIVNRQGKSAVDMIHGRYTREDQAALERPFLEYAARREESTTQQSPEQQPRKRMM